MISPIRTVGVLGISLAFLMGVAACDQTAEPTPAEPEPEVNVQPSEVQGPEVYYLEIVTPAVTETCDLLAAAHGVTFTDPIAELGNARTAELASGGAIGVRAPLRPTEDPVVRPYLLVDDLEARVKAAEEAGAEIAIPPMEIPGHGMFAIYILGGIDHGLWQR